MGANKGVVTMVSTHSRPKAAGYQVYFYAIDNVVVSTHSRPKAAGYDAAAMVEIYKVSTHSRPKAAGNHVKNCMKF